MYGNLIHLSFRITLNSVIYRIQFLFVLVSFLLFSFSIDKFFGGFINYAIKLDNYTYYELAFFILMFGVAAYFSHQKSTMETICFVPKEQMAVCKLIGIILATILISLVPLSFIFVSAFIEHTSILFTLMSLAYTFAQWVLFISLSQTLGFIFGLLVKSIYVYILAIPFAILFSYLNTTIIKFLPSLTFEQIDKISAFMSLQKPFVHGMDLDYTGPRLDLWFAVKVALVICFVVSLWAVLYCSMKHKKKSLSRFLVIFCLGCFGFFTQAYFMFFPTTYSTSEKLYITEYDNQPYSISAYSGSISLSEFSDFECTIALHKQSPAIIANIKFRLDQCFNIESISLSGKPISYNRIGDYIYLDAPQILALNDTSITFKYSGRIYYVSQSHSINIFSSTYSSALPPNFAFIPIIDGDQIAKDFSFSVLSKNALISNLDVITLGRAQYQIYGKATSVCLFSGFFSEFTYDGITFYRAAYNIKTDYIQTYNKRINDIYLNPLTGAMSKEPTPMKPKKVFEIYYLYGVLGFPVVFESDSYIMLNYGYII